MTNLQVRESAGNDSEAIELLYSAAFPNEDLTALVRGLLGLPDVAMSLVAVIEQQIVGHVVYTKCGLTGGHGEVALLGPLVVEPARQRSGIGSSIVRAGLKRLGDSGISHVYVLGDPKYYGRFGFRSEIEISPPVPLPPDLPPEWDGAWQSLALGNDAVSGPGLLVAPDPWLNPTLWSP